MRSATYVLVGGTGRLQEIGGGGPLWQYMFPLFSMQDIFSTSVYISRRVSATRHCSRGWAKQYLSRGRKVRDAEAAVLSVALRWTGVPETCNLVPVVALAGSVKMLAF